MSHVVNPSSLRFGTYSLNWTYSYKFSEFTKAFKFHLEFNFLLSQFLKLLGISLLKYHISFENSGLKLNLIIFKYINLTLSGQKVYNYLKEDIASINNPFVSVSGMSKISVVTVDSKFLSHKKPFKRLSMLGLKGDSKRFGQRINNSWFFAIDSMDEQFLNHPTFNLFNRKRTNNDINFYLKKKFFFLLNFKRAYYGFLIPCVFRLKKAMADSWFEKFERFGRQELNSFYKMSSKKSEIKPRSRRKKIKLARKFKKRIVRLLKKKKLLKSKVIKKKKINFLLVKSFLTKMFKKKVTNYYLLQHSEYLHSFFSINSYFYKYLILDFVKKKKNMLKSFIFSAPVKFNIKREDSRRQFNKFFSPNNLSLVIKKQLFLNNYLENYTAESRKETIAHLSSKLIVLSLSFLMLNKFNMVFLIKLFNAPNIFKNLDIRKDLFKNARAVKKWALPKSFKSFNYFYFSLLVGIRLRVTGPISSLVAVMLGKTVFHYKLLFCFKNIMCDLKFKSLELSFWKGTVIDAVGRVNGSDRKKYCRYSSSRMFALSTFDTIVNQTQRRSMTKYGLVNIKVLTFWNVFKKS